MTGKRYTVEEANAMLPHVAPALVELREKFEEATNIRRRVAELAVTDGGGRDRHEWNRTVARVDELLERLSQWEIELRDVSTGLIDFPGVVEGRDAYLCWRLGEESVSWWHPPDEGFAGRRPL